MTTTINAGTVKIQLDTRPTFEVKEPCDLQPFTTSTIELNKLDLITRLERSQTIFTTCLQFNSSTFCFTIQIHILCSEVNDTLGSEGHYFLDLIMLINRNNNADDDSNFISVFDNNQVEEEERKVGNTLLNIFINLPSPHTDHQLSNWCDNGDILDFLNHDIQVEIPGMKTTLYKYQKV
jgi:hypothetical protein